MLKKLDHIGIAVKDLEKALMLYEYLYGLKAGPVEVHKEYRVKLAFLPIGETRIELLEGLDEESPITKFIAKRGEGVHHLTFEVEDLEKALEILAGKGIELIDKAPRTGAHGDRVAFLHPKSTGGVLVELCEKPL